MDVVYDRARPQHFQDVINHLRLGFFVDEPLNKSMSLCTPREPHEELEEYSLNVLQQNMSFIAMLGPNQEVIGACLAGSPMKDLHKEYKDEKLHKIFGFLGSMSEDADIKKIAPLDDLLDVKIISVDNKVRGRGVGGELYRRTEELARENGYKFLRTDATALFSQKIFEKLGYETLKEVKYSEYLDENSEPIFNVEEPHTSCKLMLKRL